MSTATTSVRLGDLADVEYVTFTPRDKPSRTVTYSAWSCPERLREFIEANAGLMLEWHEYGEMGERKGQWQGYSSKYLGLIVWVKP